MKRRPAVLKAPSPLPISLTNANYNKMEDGLLRQPNLGQLDSLFGCRENSVYRFINAKKSERGFSPIPSDDTHPLNQAIAGKRHRISPRRMSSLMPPSGEVTPTNVNNVSNNQHILRPLNQATSSFSLMIRNQINNPTRNPSDNKLMDLSILSRSNTKSAHSFGLPIKIDVGTSLQLSSP